MEIQIKAPCAGVNTFNFAGRRSLSVDKSAQPYEQETVGQSHCGVNDIWSLASSAIEHPKFRMHCGRRRVLMARMLKSTTVIDSHLAGRVPFNVMAVACTLGRAPSTGFTSIHKNDLPAPGRKHIYPPGFWARVRPIHPVKHLNAAEEMANTA